MLNQVYQISKKLEPKFKQANHKNEVLGIFVLKNDFPVPAGVATAFAARDILGNMLSGVALQFSRPFSLGDSISVKTSFSSWSGPSCFLCWP